jgi:hypothetical protein
MPRLIMFSETAEVVESWWTRKYRKTAQRFAMSSGQRRKTVGTDRE